MGMVVRMPACSNCTHDHGAVRPPRRARATSACSWSTWSSASSWIRRRWASRRSHSLSAVCDKRAPQQPRRLPVAALGQRHGRQRLHPPRRARYRGPLREGGGGLRIVAGPPVVDEADVLEVLPAIGSRGNALLEQAHGEIGSARSARWRFRQEDRAEAVRDDEARIQRRREVEERIQVLERPWPGRSAAGSRRSAGWRASSTGRRRACRTTAPRASPRPASAGRARPAVRARGAAAASSACSGIAEASSSEAPISQRRRDVT